MSFKRQRTLSHVGRIYETGDGMAAYARYDTCNALDENCMLYTAEARTKYHAENQGYSCGRCRYHGMPCSLRVHRKATLPHKSVPTLLPKPALDQGAAAPKKRRLGNEVDDLRIDNSELHDEIAELKPPLLQMESQNDELDQRAIGIEGYPTVDATSVDAKPNLVIVKDEGGTYEEIEDPSAGDVELHDRHMETQDVQPPRPDPALTLDHESAMLRQRNAALNDENANLKAQLNRTEQAKAEVSAELESLRQKVREYDELHKDWTRKRKIDYQDENERLKDGIAKIDLVLETCLKDRLKSLQADLQAADAGGMLCRL